MEGLSISMIWKDQANKVKALAFSVFG